MDSSIAFPRPVRTTFARLLAARTPALAVCAAACLALSSPAASAPAGGASRPAEARAAQNASPEARAPLAELAPQLRRWLEETAASTWTMRLPDGSGAGESDGAGLRIEVQVGRLNSGLRLAPCARIEPFLPANARLWGRGYVGVRCTEGASWSTMIPVTVSVFGPALVANLPMPAGTMPRAEDFRIEEVDWTRAPGVPVTDPAWLEGRSLGRPLSAGQVLRADDLRVPQTIAAGDPVRIRVLGNGFSISASGFAMASAGDGQPLRVRTETGRMLVGTVRDRIVEIRL
ncbi:MAG TPA: flagellar basal body P-ring formation chaperone FlgA [Zeimonas sp.]|nr:flagellar basal body P-ring formation chaperone FlgA [Zeimonas sp.]